MGLTILKPESTFIPPTPPHDTSRWWRPRRFSTADPRASIEDALRYAREYDALGHCIHIALAMTYLFLLPLATAPKDWAFGLLAVWSIIRLPHTWRSYGLFLRLPLFWAALAWVGWQVTSFLWSQDLAQAWDEFKVQRMLCTPLLLWPILDRAPWLVMAALAGTLGQNLMQAAQELGWLAIRSGDEGRLRGLIHPIHGGMWFSAAMVWHLSAMLNGPGAGSTARIDQRSGLWPLWRAVSAGLLAVSLMGLLATGSRGPWIAAAVALPAALLIIPLRRPAARRPAAVFALLGIAALLLVIFAGQGMWRGRLAHAQREIDDARQRQVYWTSTGLRLALWDWAAQVWQTSPIVGVGAGDFRAEYEKLERYHQACAAAREQGMIEEVPGYLEAKAAGQDVTRLRRYGRGERIGEAHIAYMSRDHAHSTYLHTLANQGVVGLALLAAFLFIVLRQCWRDRPDHPYSDGMLFAMLCWLIGAQFDCYELNGHQLGLLGLIAALTLPRRPAARWR